MIATIEGSLSSGGRFYRGVVIIGGSLLLAGSLLLGGRYRGLLLSGDCYY